MICSVSDVPERGMPITKTGFIEVEAPAATPATASLVYTPDQIVNELPARVSVVGLDNRLQQVVGAFVILKSKLKVLDIVVIFPNGKAQF